MRYDEANMPCRGTRSGSAEGAGPLLGGVGDHPHQSPFIQCGA